MLRSAMGYLAAADATALAAETQAQCLLALAELVAEIYARSLPDDDPDVVTGDVNHAALDDLVRLCVELDRLRHQAAPAQAAPDPDTARAWEALEQAVIGKAIDLLSGPGGLASFLRRRQLGVRLGGPSLPLDVGVSRDIPAAIRRAVILRDQGRVGCPAVINNPRVP